MVTQFKSFSLLSVMFSVFLRYTILLFSIVFLNGQVIITEVMYNLEGSDRDHRVIEMTDEYIAELKREEGNNFDANHWPLFIDELNGPRRMEVIWDGLKKKGLSKRKLEKVMGLNNYRIYKEVIG